MQHRSVKIQEMSIPHGQSIPLQPWGIGKLGKNPNREKKDFVQKDSLQWPAVERCREPWTRLSCVSGERQVSFVCCTAGKGESHSLMA